MTCRHHPHEDILLGYASGGLDEATSLVVATHLTACPRCRADVAVAEAVGGMLLEEIAPAEITGFAAIVNRLDKVRIAAAATIRETGFPRTLDAYLPSSSIKWRTVGPGLRYASLIKERDVKVGLLSCAAGAEVTLHSHDGEEMAVVVAGEYQDGDQIFRYGDMQYSDETVEHRPVADQKSGCTVLLLNRGRLRAKSFLARIFMRLISM